MNGFLIDTNVLSEYNRRSGPPNAGVRRWLDATHRDLQYVSVVTLAEIQKGIGLLDEGKRRNDLQQWLDTDLEYWFSGHIVPIDRRVANRWADLQISSIRKGRPLPCMDALIAATALARDLTLVTRNVKDFEGTGVTILNPWT